MSLATVYGTAQFGTADETSASGLYTGTVTFNGTSEQSFAPNHIGCDVAFSVYNAKKDVSLDGIVAVKATGIVGNIGSVISLANSTNNTRTRQSANLGDTPVANAGLVIIGNSVAPTNNGFETGNVSAIFIPSVATNAPTSLT
jgi:hypothetical protein